MSTLVEVKSLGGKNFVRPERVIAIQTSATGSTVIVMEGGTQVTRRSRPPTSPPA